jgi:pyruvate,water dikinase
MPLVGLLKEHVGDQAELLASEATQGGDNASQAIDREIWELAATARRSPETVVALESGRAIEALRELPAAAAFVREFDALIQRHGRRSVGWDLLSEMWSERPDVVLTLVRAQLSGDGVAPDEIAGRSEARRREGTEAALAALPPEAHDGFRALVEQLDGYVAVREGRAYWQMVIAGSVRSFLLRIGATLVEGGRLDRPDDVLYLVPQDLEGDGDLRATAAEGRAAWERWLRCEPPPYIGTAGEAAAHVAAQMEASAREELRGSPASRGQLTATARIVRSPEEASRLQPGEIMVCVMTTPAWTPLFAIAGGVITETGGALSHPAITAREYAIPAIVALRDATSRIADGQTITMDGAAGTVTLDGGA